MAFARLIMTNGDDFRSVPLGFSWTTFFFGPIPALTRRDWFVGVVLVFLCVFSYGVLGMIWAFFYNKYYSRKLVTEGFKVLAIPQGTTMYEVSKYLGVATVPML